MEGAGRCKERSLSRLLTLTVPDDTTDTTATAKMSDAFTSFPSNGGIVPSIAHACAHCILHESIPYDLDPGDSIDGTDGIGRLIILASLGSLGRFAVK